MGYWEEKKKYEKEKQQKEHGNANLDWDKMWTGSVCWYCKKKFGKEGYYAQCNQSHGLFKGHILLCKECAKKCKKCGKYFCPKHIKNHKCKS